MWYKKEMQGYPPHMTSRTPNPPEMSVSRRVDNPILKITKNIRYLKSLLLHLTRGPARAERVEDWSKRTPKGLVPGTVCQFLRITTEYDPSVNKFTETRWQCAAQKLIKEVTSTGSGKLKEAAMVLERLCQPMTARLLESHSLHVTKPTQITDHCLSESNVCKSNSKSICY